jgi:cyclin-dependent kinase
MVPNLEPAGLDLLDAMLIYDPAQRISAKQALQHEYFMTDNEMDANAPVHVPVNSKGRAYR